MKDKIFDSKEKIQSAISDFSELMNHPGWKLVEQIINANIEVVTKLILDGQNMDGKEATKEEMDRLRDKLKVYKDVRSTPERIVKRLNTPEGEEPNVDPYYTTEELKEERRKNN